MAQENAALYAFNAGEVGKLTLARADVAKMRLSAACQVNWMPWVVGPMMLRPGLVYVGEVLNDSPCKTIPFVYAKDDTAHLELTAGALRVRIDEELLTRGAVGTTIADPTFQGGGSWSTSGTTAGCTASIAGGVCTLTAAALGGLAQIAQTLSIATADQNKEHGLRITITNGPVTVRIGSIAGFDDYLAQTALDTGTHSLAFTPTSASAYLQIESADQWQKTLTGVAIEAAGIVQIPTSWAQSDLPNLRWDQSADIIYVACYGQQQRMIQRRGVRPGARGWSVALYRSPDGPFHAGPDDANVTLTPAAMVGNTTITANLPFFSPTHVGALVRLFTPQQNNQQVIGAPNTWTNPTRIAGVQGDRNLDVAVSGTWSGTWSLQRSLSGPTDGFVTIGSSDTGWYQGVPDFSGPYGPDNFLDDKSNPTGTLYDNVIAWYRIGFDAGNYSSGTATMLAGNNQGGGYGVARILSYVSPTEVAVEVISPFTQISAASIWQISDWCAEFGWPTSVAFHEGRLWWFSGGTIPIAGSVSNNYTSYAEQDQYGNALGDSGAILEDFGQGPSDTISWGMSLTRLLMGREQSIASARSSNFDQAMTPTDFVVRDCSDEGAARLPGIKVGKRGIYVQQCGRKIYELFFNPSEFDYDDRDLTRLNLDIGVPGFTAIAMAVQPDHMLHLPRGDGQSAAMLYDVKDAVEGWWRIMTLGVIEDACVLPGDGQDLAGEQLEDLVYLVVRRTIDGITRRTVERLARRDQCVGAALNYQLDCALVYSGTHVSTLQIPWLPATLINVWADGAALGTTTTDTSGNFTMPDGKEHGNVVAGLGGVTVTGSVNAALDPDQLFAGLQGTLAVDTQYEGYPAEVFADIGGTGRGPQHIGSVVVQNGSITLPDGKVASTIVAFLGYVAPFMSSKLAYAAQLGSALAMKKKVDHVGLIMYDAHYQGVQYGQRFDALDALPQMEADQVTPAGTVWSEYDAPPIELPGEWDTDARLCLLAQAPNPCTVGAAVIGMKTNERP